MPASLPAPGRRRRAARLTATALTLLSLAAGAALAFEVALEGPQVRGGWVWVDMRLFDLFAPRVEESLARGMPATLEVHGELWRHRRVWFDRLENSVDASLRIRYEVWSDSYRLERPGAQPLFVSTLDSLRMVLSRPFSLPVGRLDQLQPGARYFVAVTVTLKPLSVEDVQEVEGWLSGEVREKRRSGFGAITELPKSVFDAVRNFAGLGDQRARGISADFERGALTPER